ncbi:DUF4296 domain-containing protein [Larkinella insperata]|uniref:DUF4296 domain-containing protein n=1 Tax=Larkinella insperata TaxID=332158 RepID=A0ABW3QN17_9BACT|nr:DUF4296 domain-containing protein [Larkinella insperata]
MNAQQCFPFRQWGLFVLITLLTACQNQPVEAPKNLIPEDKMARILTEIHLAEARVTKLNRLSQDSNTLIYKRLEKQIFQKFQVDTAAYSRSYSYYASNPEQFATIYKQVTEELEQRKKPADSSSTSSNSGRKNRLPVRLKNLKK